MARRLLRAVALLALWAGLLSMATAGALKLDERYRETRFRPAGPGACPLAISRTNGIVTPMCSATPGW